jgi:hypothetical protein
MRNRLINQTVSQRPAARPATVPLDHAHWKLNAGHSAGLLIARR